MFEVQQDREECKVKTESFWIQNRNGETRDKRRTRKMKVYTDKIALN